MLSHAPLATLKLQGSPMAHSESIQFETEGFYAEAVRLRRSEDWAKVAGLKTLGLAEYRGLIAQFALSEPGVR